MRFRIALAFFLRDDGAVDNHGYLLSHGLYNFDLRGLNKVTFSTPVKKQAMERIIERNNFHLDLLVALASPTKVLFFKPEKQNVPKLISVWIFHVLILGRRNVPKIGKRHNYSASFKI